MLKKDQLKIGEKYLVQVELTQRSGYLAQVLVPDGAHTAESLIIRTKALLPLPAKPKHDPYRKFKKGDIVKPCSVNGRWCSHVWEDRSGIQYEVAKDEDPLTAHMELKDPDRPQPFLVHAAFFKLVTPVEETEPYSIIVQPEDYHCVRIMKGTKIHSSIPFDEEECVCRTLEEAKAAAEAECARLNAEYRKEEQQ